MRCGADRLYFLKSNLPIVQDLTVFAETLVRRPECLLMRREYLVRDAENTYLAVGLIEDGAVEEPTRLLIAYRFAAGPKVAVVCIDYRACQRKRTVCDQSQANREVFRYTTECQSSLIASAEHRAIHPTSLCDEMNKT